MLFSGYKMSISAPVTALFHTKLPYVLAVVDKLLVPAGIFL